MMAAIASSTMSVIGSISLPKRNLRGPLAHAIVAAVILLAPATQLRAQVARDTLMPNRISDEDVVSISNALHEVRLEPTEKDARYGPHVRNVMNFWKAASDKPTGLLVNIHGGGWIVGKKHETISKNDLAQGWSVASIDYPLAEEGNFLPSMLHSAARAIQFCRSKAKEWNIDAAGIVVQGESAGSASSMWLAFHDDLAHPDSQDPVERFSSRVAGAFGWIGQSTLDPFVIKERIGIEGARSEMIWKTVKAKGLEDLMENWNRYKELALECSPLTHISKDDPVVFLLYNHDDNTPAKSTGDGIHHPNFGKLVKEKCDSLGIKCHLHINDKLTAEISSSEYLKGILNAD